MQVFCYMLANIRNLIMKALMMERVCQTANMCWLGSHFQISIYEYLHFFDQAH